MRDPNIQMLREALEMIRNNPNLPSKMQMPNGEIIDLLDGETEKMFDEIENIITPAKGSA